MKEMKKTIMYMNDKEVKGKETDSERPPKRCKLVIPRSIILRAFPQLLKSSYSVGVPYKKVPPPVARLVRLRNPPKRLTHLRSFATMVCG